MTKFHRTRVALHTRHSPIFLLYQRPPRLEAIDEKWICHCDSFYQPGLSNQSARRDVLNTGAFFEDKDVNGSNSPNKQTRHKMTGNRTFTLPKSRELYIHEQLPARIVFSYWPSFHGYCSSEIKYGSAMKNNKWSLPLTVKWYQTHGFGPSIVQQLESIVWKWPTLATCTVSRLMTHCEDSSTYQSLILASTCPILLKPNKIPSSGPSALWCCSHLWATSANLIPRLSWTMNEQWSQWEQVDARVLYSPQRPLTPWEPAT